MKPSYIEYWKGGKFHRVKGRIFTTEEEVAEWYKHNRWRVEGLSVVVPVAGGQRPLMEAAQ